ncbi:pVI [Murine adenovirus 3]|uniref:Pre-protein VI n=1 Tax=Murine adenovirus 3 TaxID=573199 RepID=C3SAU6_9ADEN|nr:pVI [Murine adenovirus 3]ACJ14516.1 pVI [Murine adenovirus 3]
MEDPFSTLAPRRGTQPLLSSWSTIGISELHGGALGWGSLWSNISRLGSSFGSNLKNLGLKAWNSSTGQALRKHLKDTNLQHKVVEGLSTGIHGAVDIARQEVERQLAKRLERYEPPRAGPPEDDDVNTVALPPKEDDIEKVLVTNIREPPPPYEALFGTEPVLEKKRKFQEEVEEKHEPPPPVMPTVTRPSPPVSLGPNRRLQHWQGTLNNIMGLGLQPTKRRRCF